ncbi:hypothetical protein HDV00_005714 [Rhizophlyctis rosea]|nr:hypothetical protein HDV00_005714 [Rhizophlyctis rosea]
MLPSISLVCGIVQTAVTIVQTVKCNKQQCTVLANRMSALGDTLKLLSDWPSTAPRAAIENLHGLATKINAYLSKLTKRTIIEEFLLFPETATKLGEYSARLTNVITDLNLATAIKDANYRDADRAARKEDQKRMDEQLQKLLTNQHVILDAVKAGNRRILEALDALEKKKAGGTGGEGDEVETKFAKAAIDILSRSCSKMDLEILKLSNSAWSITTFDLEFGDLIAEGGFGLVYEGTLHGHTPVAIKQLRDALHDTRDLKSFVHEVSVWHLLRFPYILPLLGASIKSSPPLMVSPLMRNGNVSQCKFSAVALSHSLREIKASPMNDSDPSSADVTNHPDAALSLLY